MFQVRIYDRAFGFMGAVGAWQKIQLTILRNKVEELKITIPAAHPQAVKMREKGVRIIVLDYDTGWQLFTGTIRKMNGIGPGDEQVTFTAMSDHRVLTRMLAWPDPTAALTAQPNHRMLLDMPLETILKQVVFENAQRLGVPLTVAPTQGRGGNARQAFRFNPILGHLQEPLDRSNLTIEMQQAGAGMRLDVREAVEVRKELSIGSGTLVEYDWNTEVFDSTRAVVAGQGEAAARVFRESISSTREKALGYPEEIYVDARDVEVDAELPERGWEKLLEDHDTAGLSLTLNETPSFQYGVHYHVGDQVTIQTAAGPITDKISQINLTFDRDNGQITTPIVGDRSDDPDVTLSQHIRKWAGRVSSLERR